MRNLPQKEQRATRHEVKVLQAVKHEHCIAYRDSFVCGASRLEDAKLCIVMEWASGGDLGSLIDRRKKTFQRFSEAEVLRLAYRERAGIDLSATISYLPWHAFPLISSRLAYTQTCGFARNCPALRRDVLSPCILPSRAKVAAPRSQAGQHLPVCSGQRQGRGLWYQPLPQHVRGSRANTVRYPLIHVPGDGAGTALLERRGCVGRGLYPVRTDDAPGAVDRSTRTPCRRGRRRRPHAPNLTRRAADRRASSSLLHWPCCTALCTGRP